MTLKDYRLNSGLTQKEFAELFEISLRTLQDYEQGRYDPPSIFLDVVRCLFSVDKAKQDVTLKSPFPVVIEEPFLNAAKIHPLQQKKVALLLKDAVSDPNVKRIVIFGSSVTERCHNESDLDVYIEKKEDAPFVSSIYEFEIDKWDNFSVDAYLLGEIQKKGVLVYESIS